MRPISSLSFDLSMFGACKLPPHVSMQSSNSVFAISKGRDLPKPQISLSCILASTPGSMYFKTILYDTEDGYKNWTVSKTIVKKVQKNRR